MTRFIAFYLPQYHAIKENDEWWGEGFTEWVNVARARSLFWGHKQPNIPSALGFYDLRSAEVREKQADLARMSGVEGFCYWHYWFGDGKQLLELPFSEVLKSGRPTLPFCLGWANHSWQKKTWDKHGNAKLLIEQKYLGFDDYVAHFNHLLPAFRDDRYIKVDGKNVFVIFEPLGSSEINKFITTWRLLAKKENLPDFYFIGRDACSRSKESILGLGFDSIYNDDVFNIHHQMSSFQKVKFLLNRKLLKRPTVFSYKDAIKYMITKDCEEDKVIPVIAPNWDHSPRSGSNAIILHNSHPSYFKQLVRIAQNAVRSKPVEKQIVFIKSWNEWGEGNYMEPDMQFGHGNLMALREAIDEFKVNT